MLAHHRSPPLPAIRYNAPDTHKVTSIPVYVHLRRRTVPVKGFLEAIAYPTKEKLPLTIPIATPMTWPVPSVRPCWLRGAVAQRRRREWLDRAPQRGGCPGRCQKGIETRVLEIVALAKRRRQVSADGNRTDGPPPDVLQPPRRYAGARGAASISELRRSQKGGSTGPRGDTERPGDRLAGKAVKARMSARAASRCVGDRRQLVCQGGQDSAELSVDGVAVGLVVDRVQQHAHPRPSCSSSRCGFAGAWTLCPTRRRWPPCP